MKKTLVAVIGATLVAAIGAQATPALYDFTFTGGTTVADGQLTIDGGVATGGYLDITGGPATGNYSLFTWLGGGTDSVRIADGTDIIGDNLVNLTTTPHVTSDGLAFISAAVDSQGHPITGINISAHGSSDNLARYQPGNYADPFVDGTLTFTLDTGTANAGTPSNAPDRASTAGLLGASFAALAVAGKRKQILSCFS